MSLSSDVWLIIVCALILANLPFVLDRPLAPWPWGPSSGASAPPLRWLQCGAYLGAVALWSWGTLHWVGGSFAGGGATVGLFVLKLLLSGVVAALLLAWPGWRAGAAGGAGGKPFLDRLLEVLVGYVLVGTLGFSLELNRGNAFAQRWEFYAVTLALFLVLAYPGFVWRYMLRRRRG